MKKASDMCKEPPAFTLAEVLAALVIGTMVLVAVLGVYTRAERSAAAIIRSIDGSQLPFEILQTIAEDIDRAIASGADAKVTIDNKFINSIPTSRLTIQTTFNDRRNEEQIFEKIIWQTNYDRNTDGLILYRSHSGVALEDKLLDEQKEDWERELFVPICKGLTFFRILIPAGEDFQDTWKSTALPKGITVFLSFAEPFKTRNGTFDVPESEKIIRTIAVNRTRKIKFNLIKSKPEEDEADKDEDEEDVVQDSNEPGDAEDSNEPDRDRIKR